MNEQDDDSNSADDIPPFRVLDLPLELQRPIIQAYYGTFGLKAKCVTSMIFELRLLGVPDKTLLLVNRHFYTLAGPIRRDSFNGVLDLRSIPGFIWNDRSGTISSALEAWSDRIHTILDASTGNHGPNTPRPLLPFWKQFPNLKQVEIRFSPIIFDADGIWLRGLRYTIPQLLSGEADDKIAAKIQQQPEHWISLKRQLDKEGIDLIVVLEWRKYQLTPVFADVTNEMDLFSLRARIDEDGVSVLTRSLDSP